MNGRRACEVGSGNPRPSPELQLKRNLKDNSRQRMGDITKHWNENETKEHETHQTLVNMARNTVTSIDSLWNVNYCIIIFLLALKHTPGTRRRSGKV